MTNEELQALVEVAEEGRSTYYGDCHEYGKDLSYVGEWEAVFGTLAANPEVLLPLLPEGAKVLVPRTTATVDPSANAYSIEGPWNMSNSASGELCYVELTQEEQG